MTGAPMTREDVLAQASVAREWAESRGGPVVDSWLDHTWWFPEGEMLVMGHEDGSKSYAPIFTRHLRMVRIT